jgi:hypothetical protein
MVYGILSIANETDQTLSMVIKYSSQTPFTIMNSFPVLRVPAGIRNALSKILLENKPESMLFCLLLCIG